MCQVAFTGPIHEIEPLRAAACGYGQYWRGVPLAVYFVQITEWNAGLNWPKRPVSKLARKCKIINFVAFWPFL
jgi:hypothetical protein